MGAVCLRSFKYKFKRTSITLLVGRGGGKDTKVVNRLLVNKLAFPQKIAARWCDIDMDVKRKSRTHVQRSRNVVKQCAVHCGTFGCAWFHGTQAPNVPKTPKQASSRSFLKSHKWKESALGHAFSSSMAMRPLFWCLLLW